MTDITFNIGDIVFIMSRNKIHKGQIIEYKADQYEVSYTIKLFISSEVDFRVQSEVWVSPEDLVADLLKDIK